MTRTPPGEGVRFFEEMMLVETDECVIWPYGKEYNGYGMLSLEGVSSTVHRHACKRVHGDPPRGRMDAAHSCGAKDCFNPRHLSWKTRSENLLDKRSDGTASNGGGPRVLDEGGVRSARLRYLSGERIAHVARALGADWSTVNSAIRGVTWGWIDDPGPIA